MKSESICRSDTGIISINMLQIVRLVICVQPPYVNVKHRRSNVLAQVKLLVNQSQAEKKASFALFAVIGLTRPLATHS